MELKDALTLLFSVLALAFSIIALIQKNSETKRMIRGLIADAISKLISTETEIRRITNEIRANNDNPHLRSIRNALVQQREAIAQQALYLIPQVAERFVTAVDYATLARALATDDTDLADCYWNKAINTSRGISQGRHTRSYAQFLFSQQKYEKGRATFKKATEPEFGISLHNHG
jgi:hypothetical protein